MRCTLDDQTFGSLVVFGAFAASDAAVRLLDAYPASPMVWYLNFEVFYTFELARLRDSPLAPLFGAYGLLFDAGVIVAAILARATRTRLMVAFLANFGFAAVIVLIYCRLCGPAGSGGLARTLLSEPRATEIMLGAVLLGVSFRAFMMSHLSFVVAVTQERDQHRRERETRAFRLDTPLVGATC